MSCYRTYGCDDCGAEFECFHASSDEPPPDCPQCSTVLEWRPGMFAIRTNKSRAMDVTQNILETEFGMSNIRDNQREGDVAAIVPEKTATQRDAEMRTLSEVAQAAGTPMNEHQQQMATQFWGGGAVTNAIPAANMLAGAKASTAAADAEGVNPMKLLHDAGKKGQLKTPIRIVARG